LTGLCKSVLPFLKSARPFLLLKKWAFSTINSSFFISLTLFFFIFFISLHYTLIFIILLFSIYPGVYKREIKRGNVIGAKLEVGKPHTPHGEWKGCRGNSNIALEAIFSPYAPTGVAQIIQK